MPMRTTSSLSVRPALALAALVAVAGALRAADKPTTRPAATQPATAAAAATGPRATAAGTATRPAPAAEPAKPLDPAQAAKIDQLVAQLSSDVFRERQQAQEKLVAIGRDALPTLHRLADSRAQEEVRSRARAAIRRIEDNAMVGGTRVTLKLSNVTPKEAFEQLGKQCKYDFPTFPPTLWEQERNWNPVSVDFDNVPFWTALKELCGKSGVFPQPYGNNNRMTLHRGGGMNYWSGPTQVSGPFLVCANRIQRTNSVDLAAPDNIQKEFYVQFTILAEPKVRVIQSDNQIDIKEAVDDRGNSLLSTDRSYYGMGGQAWMWNMSARLNYPDNAGKKIARLRGEVKFVLQVQAESLDVPDILTAKNIEKTVAGRQFLIKECKANGENYELQMTVFRGGMSDADWNAIQNPGAAMKLVDKSGRALSMHGWGGSNDGRKMDYTWNFSRQQWGGEAGKPGEPHRLTWEIPTETRDTVATFEFKDLPLP